MTKLDQFRKLLEELDSDSKDNLLGAFKEVESVFTETIDRRDSVSKTNRELKDTLKSFGGALKLNEDFTLEDVSNFVSDLDKKGNKNEEVEKIKAEMQLRYDTDTKALSDKFSTKEIEFNDLTTKHNDSMFMNEITNSGVLSKFVDEPMARTNIMNMIREKSVRGEDGKIYAKDAITGGVLKDINNSNAPLGLDYLVSDISSTINPIYLAPEAKANGGGVPPNQINTNQHGNKKIDTSKYKNTEDFIGDAMNSIKS